MTKIYKIHGSIADTMRAEAGGYRRKKAEALAKAGVFYRPAKYIQYLEKYLFKKAYEKSLLRYLDIKETFTEPAFIAKLYQQAAEAHSASEALKLQLLTNSAEASVRHAVTPVYITPEHADSLDASAVRIKLRARHAVTGSQYFAKLQKSTTLAMNGISDGIGEDLLHAAALGRLEADAYARDVIHNLPLTLKGFFVALEDLGGYHKLERSFQFSEIQKVIDDDMRGGATGTRTTEHRTESDAVTITTEMVKSGDSIELLMLSILKRKSLVKIFMLYADGVPMAEIADIVGDTVKSVEHHIYRAKKKLEAAGIKAFLK